MFPLILVGLLLCLFVTGEARAEGRCPPGQYPIGGQGVGGCAPIPGSGTGGVQSGPIATGRWIKTWGAIAGGGKHGRYGGFRWKAFQARGCLRSACSVRDTWSERLQDRYNVQEPVRRIC